jgi:hypothetical protein
VLVVGHRRSCGSDDVLSVAGDLARRLGAVVHVVHAISLDDYPVDPDAADWEDQAARELEDQRMEVEWRCCVGESRTDIAVEALASDGQREFAEDRFEPVTGHGVESEFVVAAAKVLHKRVPAADRLRAA